MVEGQEAGLAKICRDSRDHELEYYITNNMHDETRILLGKPERRGSCLAWHSQVTYQPQASAHVSASGDDADTFMSNKCAAQHPAVVKA